MPGLRRFVWACSLMTMAGAGGASAVPQGAFWVETAVVDSPVDGVNLAGFRSFDLYIQLQTGDVVYAMDSGIAGPNSGLQYNPSQTIFNHPIGGDAGVNPALQLSLFPDLAFDTRSQMGTLPFGSFGTPVGPWTYDGGQITGVTSANVPTPGEAPPDVSGAFWFGRFTISSAGGFGEATGVLGEYLGGQVFLLGSMPNGEFGGNIPATGVVNVPNAFGQLIPPSPGGAGVLVVAGLGAARRRRR